jgi:hypothetical protein
MVAQIRREIGPLDLWHSASECHPRQLLFELLYFGGILAGPQSFRQFEKPAFFGLFGLEPAFDQSFEHAIGALPLSSCQAAHFGVRFRGQRNASPHGFPGVLRYCHDYTTLHQFTPPWQRAYRSCRASDAIVRLSWPHLETVNLKLVWQGSGLVDGQNRGSVGAGERGREIAGGVNLHAVHTHDVVTN